MSQALRVAVADDEPDMLEYLVKTLPLLGHQVVVTARTGRELLEQCRACAPDLVITDIKMPDLDGLDAATALVKERPTPVLLVSAYHNPEYLERAKADGIFGYLVKPIKQSDLPPAIALAMRRFREFEGLQKESAALREALEDRKMIERAKGALMKRAGVDEEEAHRRLQKLATDRRSKLAEMARLVLAVEDAYRPPEGA
jgi:response regulator NasT